MKIKSEHFEAVKIQETANWQIQDLIKDEVIYSDVPSEDLAAILALSESLYDSDGDAW